VAKIGQPARVTVGDKTVLGVIGDHQVTEGQTVTLAIRPEKIRLYPISDNGLENTFMDAGAFAEFMRRNNGSTEPQSSITQGGNDHVLINGRVAEVVYIGTDMRYEVELSENARIVARIQNIGLRYDKPFETGDEVYVHWLADNAQILTQ
jgi:ABC-type Fe3+/spermidine/putrescine transport system ATPase subunit